MTVTCTNWDKRANQGWIRVWTTIGEVVEKGGREGGRLAARVGTGKTGTRGQQWMDGSDGGQVLDHSVDGPDGGLQRGREGGNGVGQGDGRRAGGLATRRSVTWSQHWEPKIGHAWPW